MQFALLTVLVAFFGNIILGLFTYLKNPKSFTNRLFFFFTISLGLYLFINYLALHQVADSATLFWIRQVMAIALGINLLYFLLVVTFPYSKLQLSSKRLWTSILSTLILLSTTQTSLVFKAVEPNSTQPIPGLGMPLFVLHTLIFLGGGFVILIKKFRESTGLAKIQFKLFLLGTILMFVSIVVTNLLFVIFLNTTAFVGLLPLYILIFICFITYAIVKHRFLDIRLIVARSVAYTLLVILLGLVYAGGVFLVGTYFTRAPLTQSEILSLTILALVVAFTFQPLRHILEDITDNIFYKGRYDSHTLLARLGHIMASTLQLEDLGSKVLQELIAQMKITAGYIVLTKFSSIIWTKASEEGKPKPQFAEKDIIYLIKSRREKSGEDLLIFEELTESQEKEVMRKYNLAVVLPLIVEQETIGALLLKERSSGDIYSVEDIKILKIIAPELAVAVKNAESYEEIRRFNITLRNEVERATENLRKANKRLRELDELKDEFVSITSHELRTPMTAVKSYLWMLLNKKRALFDPKTQEYLDRAYISTERTINLVNGMLDVSRIESGRFELKKESIDVVQVAQDVNKELSGKVQEKQLQLQVEKRELPLVYADRDKIHQVLDNLVGNAIKFTPRNGTISVTFGKKNGVVEVKVQDTGSGISKEDQKRLFKKFGRLENSFVSIAESGGTGLGLFISKQIIGLHGGNIWVDSAPGKGATFSFTLPVVK